MKIVYCLNSIRGMGGMQRVTIVKANALAEIEGNEIYVVVTDNKNASQVDKLSSRVHLVDLNINYYDGDTERSKIANIVVYKQKIRQHRKALEVFLRDLKPDIVVSVGGFEKYLLLSMKNRSWKVIREFHFERNYRIKHSKTTFDKLMSYATDFYDFHFKEKKYDYIFLLTNEDRNINWGGYEKTIVMPNPVSFKCLDPSPLIDKCVVMVGRLDPIKNCRAAVRAFKIVADYHPDWVLKIYGGGSEKQLIEKQINDLGLQDNVLLMGYSSDVKDVYCHSSISIMTSRSEGFPMSMIESLECGVPVVSYQCPCGPKEIITDGENGFLVPIDDERAMADRICQLIEDEDLRKRMGALAKLKAQDYQIEAIVQRWMSFFREIVES